MSRRSARAPSQRQLRVGELIRHALTDLVLRGDIHDPDIEGSMPTISEVAMSPDLKIATVYLAPLGGEDGTVLVKAFARNARFLRGRIATAVNLKYAPDLRFRHDETFNEAGKIDALLRAPNVKRDLQAADVDNADTVDEDK